MRMRVCYKGDGVPVYYRPDTTDEKVIREVVDNRAYRRASIGFDVEAGEHWLDLGANIGAFAVYCKTRGGNRRVLRAGTWLFQHPSEERWGVAVSSDSRQ